MANQVYANTREVSCKAAAGKAVAAFPDVCFTPPTTPATPPGVPIPYPNTGMASDATDGSKTVKISGKEVMLKNKSCFSKSTGDEAGAAPKKGVVTSKNMGKVYFTAWSMDVKIEGENVVRHLDMTTHNHASLPGNSPPWPYLDEMAMAEGGPCADLAKKLEDNCSKHIKKFKSSGAIKLAATKAAMCKNTKCKQARKCVLSPFSLTRRTCCDGKTPHHVVPAHCFMPPGTRKAKGSARYAGCEKYVDDDAPCICVTGELKSTGAHKLAHDHFDKIEDNQTGHSWSYKQASETGVASVKAATGGKASGCDEKCTKAQVDSYHKDKAKIKDDTPIRADSTGKRTLETFEPKLPKGTVE